MILLSILRNAYIMINYAENIPSVFVKRKFLHYMIMNDVSKGEAFEFGVRQTTQIRFIYSCQQNDFNNVKSYPHVRSNTRIAYQRNHSIYEIYFSTSQYPKSYYLFSYSYSNLRSIPGDVDDCGVSVARVGL